MTNYDRVIDFNKEHGLPLPSRPTQLTEDLFNYRMALVAGEVGELRRSYMEGNVPDQADALVDLVYVVLGSAAMMGLDFDAHFLRVHLQNLPPFKKKAMSGWGINKTVDYVAPEHADILSLTKDLKVE